MADTLDCPLTGCRILVVEDEYLLADDMRMHVEQFGGEVVGPLGTIGGAQELSDLSRIDVAFVDVNLRGETSFTLVDRLCDNDVRVILVSGYDHSVLPERYRHLPFLQKPLTRGVMASAVSMRPMGLAS